MPNRTKRLTCFSKVKAWGLDQQRRIRFRNEPTWFIEQCETLGLFTTRLPAFKQLFFYEFNELEKQSHSDQPASSSSSGRRAAEAYLISGIRFESLCGISGVWYRYVESHQSLFDRGAGPPLPLQQQARHPLPRFSHYHEQELCTVFKWERMHTRPQPRKIQPVQAGGRLAIATTSASSRTSIVANLLLLSRSRRKARPG